MRKVCRIDERSFGLANAVTITTIDVLERLLSGQNLSEAEAGDVMRLLADEALPPATAGALLAALRAKGETPAEVRGFAQQMRALANTVQLPPGAVAAECAGTGGDGSGSFNLSTGSALLAAACGVSMVKCGNRSISSKSGSSDALTALGIPLPKNSDEVLQCLEECGFTFMFAPYFHPAMKIVAPVRTAMGVRTVFNILGPLTNPARPPFSAVGAFDLPTARLMAATLAGMSQKRAFVIHGEPGWDEATPAGRFTLFDVKSGNIGEQQREPLDFGLPRCSPQDLIGGDAEYNARALEAVFRGKDHGAHRDALTLGAGLILEVTGTVDDLAAGIKTARRALDSGAATDVLTRLRTWRAS